MKKFIILGTLNLFLFAQNDIYLEYVNKLVNYNFVLKNIENKNAPFEIKEKQNKVFNQFQKLEKKIKVKLINIFDNQAYVKIIHYLGDQITKVEKKWIKVGDKIGTCKVDRITFDSLILKCKHKTITKTVNKKIINIKEER
ncbi:hypothetical protein FE773_03510 [Caminibacter mediatlanticus TB-2]|uniref:Pilus assembly protein PilP n=1 Tax=Caminibacter mediatlanticus TB-2 TaxID=391592 RepID=A0ABX5V7N1_9BACT|nr:hypothetical protein [Caminibacter mediatlanticus]QCT94278.1 hypothetical protein FE773_03510 [Caminibacter mediatlanticus TB-2]